MENEISYAPTPKKSNTKWIIIILVLLLLCCCCLLLGLGYVYSNYDSWGDPLNFYGMLPHMRNAVSAVLL